MNQGRKIALLTAAGIAKRFGGLMAKEMYPLTFEVEEGGKHVPVPISRSTFDTLAEINPDLFAFVVRWDKPEILRYYGSGARLQQKIMYLVQDEPISQYQAMSHVRPFLLPGDTVYYAMPDTAIHPKSLFTEVESTHVAKQADLTIGLFQVDEPQHFTTVELTSEGEFLKAEVKPDKPSTDWIWGVLIFNEKFFATGDKLGLHQEGAVGSDDVGTILNHAAKNGLTVACHKVTDGRYRDFANFQRVVNYIQDVAI